MSDSRIIAYEVPFGHSEPPREYSLIEDIVSVGPFFWDIRFQLGLIGGTVTFKIVRSFFFGLTQTTWEVVGPAGSRHRLPNGAIVFIGDEKPGKHNEIRTVTVKLQAALPMWRKAVEVANA